MHYDATPPLLIPRSFHHGRYWEKDKKQIDPRPNKAERKKIMKTWMYQMAIASILVLLIAIASSSVLMLMAEAAPSDPPIAETVGMYHEDYFC